MHHNLCPRSQGPTLEIVLPFQQATHARSGVDLLLQEDNLQNVEGYVTNRATLDAKKAEAQKLLVVQKELGFNFAQEEDLMVERLIEMEDRDREEFVKNQESHYKKTALERLPKTGAKYQKADATTI
jgi:adenylate kinase family enzyme